MSSTYPIENALFNWESGASHLELVEGRDGGVLALVTVEAIRDGLRQRIGSTYRAADLARLYGEGTDWVRQLPAIDSARPDLVELTDAAFWLMLQNASDFAGGRLITEENEG